MRSIILRISPLFILLTGCSSVLIIESTPENAEVFVKKENDVPQKLGKTPMTITRDNASWLFTDNVELIAKKDGYQAERILIPGARSSVRSHWSVALQPEVGDGKESRNSYTALAQGVAEVQNDIHLKNLRQAETKLEILLSKYQNVSVLYDLLGNIYYLRKDLEKALEMYRKSSSLNSENIETTKMIDKITRIRSEKKGG